MTEIEDKIEPTLARTQYIRIFFRQYTISENNLSDFQQPIVVKMKKPFETIYSFYLEPSFEGSATGETFNKTGKTDILIRHENSNAFIAECKFWKGKKVYLDAITQLLGYLTWRDSKAAIIVFVDNKDFSSVIQTAEKVTSTHSNYLGFVDKKHDTWLNYRFHINGDPNREVKLGVLFFHIPEQE